MRFHRLFIDRELDRSFRIGGGANSEQLQLLYDIPFMGPRDARRGIDDTSRTDVIGFFLRYLS